MEILKIELRRFIKKYKNVFEEDGIFYGNKVENEFIEFDDYYD